MERDRACAERPERNVVSDPKYQAGDSVESAVTTPEAPVRADDRELHQPGASVIAKFSVSAADVETL